MKVCIAEKPSVAQEIARVLGAKTRANGFYEGNGYCVTWVFGHLCELKEPHDYNTIWRQWNKYDLPILPERFGIKLRDDKGVKKQFEIIKGLVDNAEEVINCGDAGQEGELIQRWVLQMAGMHCPMKRLWISSLTEEAIREGFNNLRPGSDFDNLYAAGSARAIGDWLLGMNATRAFTLRYARGKQVLSVGRVQTPTLALIVQRWNEIRNFRPETYWELKTLYRGATFNATAGRYTKKPDAEAALAKITGSTLCITDVQTKEGNEAPPRLFDLTSLQVECNKKFAFSAEDALRIIQSLYEKKLTTYPRVDTTYLSEDLYPKIPQTLRGLVPYQQFVAPLLQKPIKKSKKIFDNAKVTDHHAIIPTGVPPSSNLPRDEKLVYDLVARRFIANFYPDSRIATTTVMADAAGVGFKCSGKQILSPGWRTVIGRQRRTDDEKPDEEETTLPHFDRGESGPHEPSIAEKQTQPPKLYTEATLLRAMETAGKQVDDDELRDLMKENGIGRPSTRAAIIETLFKRNYIVKERKSLVPTSVGIGLIGLIRNELLKSAELTGQWEKKLRMIERGDYDIAHFIADMRGMAGEVVGSVLGDTSNAYIEAIDVSHKPKAPARTAKQQPAQQPAGQPDTMPCPRCGRPIVRGKSAWGCSGFREGCTVVVPFEVMGKRLTDNQTKALFTKGQTPVVRGLDVGGRKVDGRIAFDSSFSLVVKENEATPVDVGTIACPLCGAPLMSGRAAWGCSRYAEGCGFRVPYVFMGKRLTLTQLSVLSKKRATNVIAGFVDDAGRKVSGRLVVNADGRVTLNTGSTDGGLSQ